MHALTDMHVAAICAALAITLGLVGSVSAAGYRRGRQIAITSTVEHYEPRIAALQQTTDDMARDILRTRTAYDQHQADSAALIEELTARLDTATSLQAEHRTEVLRAANILSLAAQTWAPMGATMEARNALTCATRLRTIASTLGADDVQEVAA